MPQFQPIVGQEDTIPPSVLEELQHRYDELTLLQKQGVQMGTSVPQLYGSLSKFIANPSTVSVETFKRMRDTDETIGAMLEFLSLAMIARMGEYKHPSREITEFVKRSLDNMEGSWHQNLAEMFTAESDGFSVTEKVWQYDENFGGMPAYRPKKLITYPSLTIVFAVDRHGNLEPEGIHQYQRYHNSFFQSARPYGGIFAEDLSGFRPDLYASIGDFPYPIRVAADLTYLTVKMPTNKVIHLKSSAQGNFGNPYGRSILRRAYKSWVTKDALLKMWLVAADRKGTPLLVAYGDPTQSAESEVHGDHKHQHGKEDYRPESLLDAMGRVLKTVHNSSFIIVPGKKGEVAEITSVDVTGDMNVFKDAVAYCNASMMRAGLIPPLVMGGDGGGSFSLGQEHHKIFNRVVDGKLKPYKQDIKQQFIKDIIAYNFPKSAWEKDGLGDFALEEYDVEMMEKLANVFNTLTTAGYMTPSAQEDMDEVRKRIPMPAKLAVAPPAPLEGDPGFEAGGAEEVRDDENSQNKPGEKKPAAAGDPAKPGEEAVLPGQASKADEEEEAEVEHPEV